VISLKIINDTAQSINRSVPFSFFQQKEKANGLAIFLPGAGYTNQAPLLHFTTKVFYNKGYEILHVNYNYSKEVLHSLSEEEFTIDVQAVINKILTEYQYKHFCIVSKSIGSIVMSYLLKDITFQNAKTIWLTPLLKIRDVYTALLNSNHNGICICGDQDPYYDKEKFEELNGNKNINPILIKGVNHQLEIEDNPIKSIEVLKEIIIKIENF
jgi:hypothetical protein